MKTVRINLFGWFGVGLVIFALLAGCSSAPSPRLDVEGVWLGTDGSVYYLIQPGDTPIGISKKVNVPLEELFVLNELDETSLIYAGSNLLVGQVAVATADSYFAAAGPSADELVTIDEIEINRGPADSYPPYFGVIVTGQLHDNCTSLQKRDGELTITQQGRLYIIHINPTRINNGNCDQTPQPFYIEVGLPGSEFNSGIYTVRVNQVETQFEVSETEAYTASDAQVVNAISQLVHDDILETYEVEAGIISLDKATWPDTCLGLGEADESCAAVLTPGYYVLAGSGLQLWVYHTNQDGSLLRSYVTDTATFSPLSPDQIPTAERAGPLETTLLVSNIKGEVLSPAYSPDGRYLAFVQVRVGEFNLSEIHILDLAANEVHTVATLNGNNVSPRWSPDGTKLLFTFQETNGQPTHSKDINADVYVVNIDGTGLTQLTADPAYDYAGAWSPDGRQIVFWSQRNDVQDLYRVNVDGSGLTRLTENIGVPRDPQWSPDGSKLVFTLFTDEGRQAHIYTLNPDGSGLTPMTATGYNVEPHWSPDGRQILFGRDGDLYVMNANGAAMRQLTAHPGHEYGAVWSPDGSQIAFQADWGGGFDIFVMNANGSNLRWENNPGVDDLFPIWSPNGQHLVFIANHRNVGTAGIWLVALDSFVAWE